MNVGNSSCIGRQHGRLRDKKPFVPPLQCHNLMSHLRQTRHMWLLGRCYCLKPWLDRLHARQFFISLFTTTRVVQDLSRKTNVSVRYPSTPEDKAASTCCGALARILELEDLGVCSVSAAHRGRGVGSGGRERSLSLGNSHVIYKIPRSCCET